MQVSQHLSKLAICAPNVLGKIAGKQNFIQLTSSNFVTISYISYLDQVNSYKNFWTFWNGPLCRNKLDPCSPLNVAAYWQNSQTKACAKKLSQIFANNIDNGGRGIGLRICGRYCSFLSLHATLKYIPILNHVNKEDLIKKELETHDKKLRLMWHCCNEKQIYSKKHNKPKRYLVIQI